MATAARDWFVCSVALLCLSVIVEGARLEDCPGSMPPDNFTTGFLGYSNRIIDDGSCNSTLFCRAMISPGAIQRRTWFITDVKDEIGLWYLDNWAQRHNVACPKNNILHLFPQEINLGRTTGSTEDCSLSTDDTVLVQDGEAVYIDCGTEFTSGLPNRGMGQQFFNRSIQLDFCAISPNQPTRNGGFVYRSTCLNPCDYALPGCLDFNFFMRWDPDFIFDFVNATFPDVERLPLPHRRKKSVEKLEKNIEKVNQHMIKKRGLRRLNRILSETDTVTYEDSVVLINGGFLEEDRIEDVICLITTNPLIKTRKFYRNFEAGYPLTTFFGPGKIDIYGFIGTLSWTIPNPDEFFLPTGALPNVVNRIYDYIYQQWYRPYPIIAIPEADPLVFPLPNATDLITPLRRSTDVDVVFPILENPNNQCRQAAIIDEVPLLNTTIADSQIRFCRYFADACDLNLRVACRELLALRPSYIV